MPTQSPRQQLEGIIERTRPKGVIVYPPTLGWSYAHQRPQQILKAAAELGYLCIFCTTQPQQDQVTDGLRRINERLYIADGIEGITGLQDPILYITWPLHDTHVGRFVNPLVWYDCIDDLSLFLQELDPVTGAAMIDSDTRLTYEAGIITATADKLLEQQRVRRPDAILVENGTVLADFERTVREEEIPTDIRRILAQGKPIIGYYGALADWFDYDMVIEIARANPQWNIVLIGMDYEGSLARNKPRLDALPNIHFLGRKDYEELYKYSHCFDVGLIPFKRNRIIEATNPVKMFEYMAAGIPVVSVDIPEARKYSEVVLTASTVEEYTSQIGRAIALKRDEEYLKRLRQTAQRSTWCERFKLVDEAIFTITERRSQGYALGLEEVVQTNERAIHALAQGDYGTAVTTLKQLIDRGVRAPWLFFNYAQALIGQGQYGQAVYALEQEVSVNQHHLVYSQLAYSYAQVGNFDAAHRYIELAKQTRGTEENWMVSAVYTGIGDMSQVAEIHFASGRREEAYFTYLCGLMRTPNDARLRAGFSRVSSALGRT
jgi:glycosyltransferase involved in cell wall biosynthesis